MGGNKVREICEGGDGKMARTKEYQGNGSYSTGRVELGRLPKYFEYMRFAFVGRKV